LDETAVKVNFEIRQGVKLPKDSEIRIQNIGLMGERQVGIRLGTEKEIVAAGGVFEGRLDAGIAEAMGVAGEVFVEAETLVKSLRRVLDSTVARPEFVGRVNSLISTTEEMTRRLNKLSKDVDPQIRSGVSTFQGLSKEVDGFVRDQEPRIQKVLENAGDAAERAKALAERGEKVAQGLEEVLAKANSRDGTVGALLNDTTLHRDLRAALESADSLFRVIKKKGLDVNIDLF
jgi:phospholipid/cholesterol/gamma-HCH transport system substrate-binding protein